MRTFSFLVLLVASAHAQDSDAEQREVCHSPAQVQSLEGELAQARAEVQKLRSELVAAQTASKAQVQQLDGDLAQARTEVQTLRSGQADGNVISVAAMASQMGGILGNAIEEQLKQTDLDDKAYEHISKHYGSVSAFAQNLVAQVSAVDYNAHLSMVTDKYSTHVAPHVLTATTMAQPHWEQHVQPLMEKAGVHLKPHLEVAKGHVDRHYKTFETDHLPLLKTKGNQAYEKVSDFSKLGVEAVLEKAMSPIFALLVKAAPNHAKALPAQPLDQLLLLVVMVLALYISLRAGWVALRVALKTTRIGAKITLVLTKVAVFLPISLVLRVLQFTLWISTGFYCCGLCRRKSVAKKGAESKGASKDKAEAAKKVSLEDVVALLTEAQKKKKLDEAVKQAVKLCKSGKAFSQPKHMEGKIVTQDTLKGALKKLGVDSKGLF
jgi:hypothetical protein